MKPRGLIVFDMDGVIVDVSKSYRETVRQTARLFFQGARGWSELPDPLFSLSDLARVKQSGGLNNDWDLTFAVINLLFTQLEHPPTPEEADSWTAYSTAMGSCDVSTLTRFLDSQDTPLVKLLEVHGRPRHAFINGLYAGDVGSGNIIKQIFQEIYLGRELFEPTYGIHTEVFHDDGYINREHLLIKKTILEQLAKNNTLAIATGRPKAEADYPLDHFDIRKFFNTVYTLDDCLDEEEKIFLKEGRRISLSKPDPFMLDAISDLIHHDVSKCFYIGDMPDDMLAAANAAVDFTGIGIVTSAPDKQRLRADLLKAGADYIVDDFNELLGII